MAAVLSIAAIVSFGRSCIQLGSDLTEVQNVVDVTFGAMSKQVDAFSKNAITQFGLSETAAKKYMGIYGAMSKSFGFDPEETYAISAAITGLTGDVASFYNIPIEQASTRLKAIWTGETESLKELGVVMTQNALDQFALANGYGRTTSKMSEQEKVMLRYKFVLDQLSDASGDFQRTSGQWANQTRVLSLQFDQLKATIGQGLINAFTPVIQIINTILAKLQTLANYFKAFTQALFGHAGGGSNPVAKAADSMSSAAGSSGALARNMGRAADSAKKMKDYTLGIDELNILRPEEENGGSGGSGGEGGGGGVPDFGNMGGELFGEVTVNPEIEEAVARMKEALDRLKDAAKPTTDAIKRLWDEGLNLLGRFTWTALKDFWDYFLVPLGSWALGEGLPRFFDITNNLLKDINWDKLNESLKELWKELEPFAVHIGNGLLWFYEYVLSPLSSFTISYIIPDFLDRISEALNDIDYYVEKVKPAFEWLTEKLDWLKELGENTPIIKEIVSKSTVDNFLDSVTGFKTVSDFCDTIDTLQTFETWWNEGVVPYFDEERWKDLWRVLKTAMIIVLAETFGIWFIKIQKWWDEDVAPWFTSKRWEELFKTIRDELSGTWFEAVTKWISDMPKWWNNNVTPWFTIARWKELYKSINSQLEQTWSETSEQWKTNISAWWNKDVAPWFTAEKWLSVYENIKTSIKTKWDEAVGVWNTDIKNWWDNNVSPWFTIEKWTEIMNKVPVAFKTTFHNALEGARSLFNTFIDWLNKKMKFEWDDFEIMGQTIVQGGSVQLFTIPRIPAFATGGFPEDGLFMANSGEMVGKFSNGRTAVANNEQIVSGIQRGVESANEEQSQLLREAVEILNALLDKDSVIQMDSREVGKSMRASERRGGYKLRTT